MRLGKFFDGLIAILLFVTAMVAMAAMLVGCSSQKKVRTQVEEEQSVTRFEVSNITKEEVNNGISMSVRIDTTKMGIVRIVTVYDTEKAVMDEGEWKSPVLRIEREETTIDARVSERDSTWIQQNRMESDSMVLSLDSLTSEHIEIDKEKTIKPEAKGIGCWIWGVVFGLLAGLLIIAKLGNRFPFKM